MRSRRAFLALGQAVIVGIRIRVPLAGSRKPCGDGPRVRQPVAVTIGRRWLARLVDPLFDPARDKPRFKALLKRRRYPESMRR
jgi:hypothetical protein